MTMTDVANAINSKNGGVTATTANGQLRLSATQTGAASAITLSNITGGAAAIGLSTQVAGRDASGTVDGNAFTSASNNVTSAISGVTLNLTAATGADGVTLAVNPAQVDNAAITTRLQTFVTAYNDVIKTASNELNEKKVINPQTDSDILKGAMFGNQTLQSIVDSLRDAFISPVSGLSGAQSIASFAGLSTGRCRLRRRHGPAHARHGRAQQGARRRLRRDQGAVHDEWRRQQLGRVDAAHLDLLVERGEERRDHHQRDQRVHAGVAGPAGSDRRL